MKAISLSLFGSNPVYTVGALRNAELAPQVYAGWRVIVYHDHTVPKDILKALEKLRVELRTDKDVSNTMFARFLIADDPACERFIVRDADSRLGAREAAAVKEWEESGLALHTMGDHMHHWLPIGGGLWSAKGGALKDMKALILKSGMAATPYMRETCYSMDQAFLARYVLPQVPREQVMRHDSCCRAVYPWARPFPGGCRFGDYRFVGECYTETDEPHPIHWQQRVNFMTP